MNAETPYQLFAIAVFVITMSIGLTHRLQAHAAQPEDDTSPKDEGSLLLSLRRVFALLLWGSTLVYLINPAWMAWAHLPLPTWLRWTGGVLMVICLPLVYWLFSSLGKNITGTVAIRKEHTLVTHGPYRWVRHPLYSVAFLLFTGFSFLSANWFIPLTVLGTMFILTQRTPIEEAKLIERFGDEYRQYMLETGRYFPRI